MTIASDSTSETPMPARSTALSVHMAAGRTNRSPWFAHRTKLLVTIGELAIAVTARSMRSKTDQETDPVELELNWIPIGGGNPAIVLFARDRISVPGNPFAPSAPPPKRGRRGSIRTVVFGMIVR